jgi:ribulose-5-phosphate 4-epimerase/fuculose-1-phosphate aldolase
MSLKPATEAATDMSEEEWATRVELAALYRLADLYGMSDITNQTIGARVRGEPEHFLMCPRGRMFEEIRASDLVKVDLDGNALDGPGIWVGGEDWDLAAVAGERWISHGAVNLGMWIFKTRPDRNFFIHAHDEEVQAVSATEGRLQAVSQAAVYLGHLIGYLDYDFAEDDDYADLFCRTVAGHEIIAARNHGYYTLGRRASEAFFRAYYLREACSVQVKAAATAAGLGERLRPIDPQRVAMLQDQMSASGHYAYDGSTEWAALLRKLARICPDYAT